MKRKPIIYIFAALALYLVSSGLSYAVFTTSGAQPTKVALVPDPSGAPVNLLSILPFRGLRNVH